MNTDRYLKIEQWARLRYTVNGRLVLSIGKHKSKYSRIILAAWNKLMLNQGVT